MPTYSEYSETASATTEAEITPFLPPRRMRFFLLAPAVVFAARVNQTIFTYPLSQVSYDGVTTGTYTDIRIGMTILFGTSAGAFNLGAQRVRAAPTDSILYFGRSSIGVNDGEVDLDDDIYITVVDLYQVWARPPYIDTDGTVRKDPGLDVEWRTTTPPPKANIGPGVAGTINPGNSLLTVDFDGTASFATTEGASITTYLWEVEDGTITVGTSASSAITVTFPAGFRWVHLTVTDSEGHSHTAHAPIFARDPADDETIHAFQITNHRISQSGQSISVLVRESIPASTYLPGTLALLWNGEPADAADRSHMIFIGWMGRVDHATEDMETATLSDTTLELVDVAGRLKELPVFPMTVQDDSLRNTSKYPAITWAHFVDLNLDYFMDYLFRWHTTAFSLADYTPSGTGSDYIATALASVGSNLWDQIARKAASLVPDYVLTCNRLGQLRVLPDPIIHEVADRTSTVQTSLTAADWRDIRFYSRRHPPLHWLTSNAVQVGNTYPITTLFCIAPGEAPGQGESSQDHGEQLAINQLQLNQAEGHRWARMTARQTGWRILFAQGDDQGIEPADMTWVETTIPANLAAQRGFTLTDSRGLPLELNIRYEYRSTGIVKTVEMLWERETIGKPAVTVVKVARPDMPSDDTTWPGDYYGSPPGAIVQPPPIPPLPLYQGQEKVAIIDKYGQIFRTSDFTSGGSSPTWDRKILTGPSGTEQIHSFVVNPFSPLYRNLGTKVNGWIATEHYIYFVDDIFGTTPTATLVYTFPEVANPALDRFRSIQASFGRFQAVEEDNPWLVVISHYASRPSFEGTWSTVSTDGGQSWHEGSHLSDQYDPDTGTNRTGAIGLYLSPRTPGLVYTATYETGTNARGDFSEDWGDSFAGLITPDIDPGDSLGGDIHVPWQDNLNEYIVYHGHMTKGSSYNYRLFRTPSAGTLGSDISPSLSGKVYGVNRYSFAVRTFDQDRKYVLLCGIGNDTTAAEADDKFAAFISSNYGDTWTNIVATLNQSDPHPEHGAFAADTQEVLYLWGTQRFISASYDFGATIIDKRGNLNSSFPTDIRDLIGLCGGDAPA